MTSSGVRGLGRDVVVLHSSAPWLLLVSTDPKNKADVKGNLPPGKINIGHIDR